MQLQRTLDTVAFLYDFATTGGAVGSYDLQVPVPINCFKVEFMVFATILPTSATSAATVSFDGIATDVSPNVPQIGSLLPATVITAWAFNAIVIGINPSGVALTVTPSKDNHSISIGMSIGVEPLLSGQLQGYLRYIGFDF